MVDAPHLARAKAVLARAGIMRMKYRTLGNTGVRVSQLGLGTMPFGGDTDEDEAGAIVAACLDVGINLFDCADVYTGGRAETILGRLIAPVRDDVVLATKVGFPSGEGVNRRGTSAAHVRLSVERSLARLGTDRIDLYYLHRFDRAHRPRPHAAHARRARHGRQDPAHRREQLRRLAGRDRARPCALHGWAPIVAIQPMYNLVKRQVEVELLPLAQSADLAVFPYSPLAGGLLTGKYGTTPGSGDGRLVTNPMYRSATATRPGSSPPPSSPSSPPRSVATRRRSPSRGSAATRRSPRR